MAILYTSNPPRKIVGGNRNADIGMQIHVPDGETLQLKRIDISNVFIALIKTGNGMLVIDELIIHEYGGDAINLRGSHLRIKSLVTYNNTPTRPSFETLERQGSESVKEALARTNQTVYDPSLLEWDTNNKIGVYHQDCILQGYSVKEDGYTLDIDRPLRDVCIESIHATFKGRGAQGLMLSEACHNIDWTLGTERLYIRCDYPYPIVMNSGENITIGNHSAMMTGKVKIQNVKGQHKRIEISK
jgi:hypothetical protein